MTGIKKPAFPNLQPAQVNRSLDKLADTVKASQAADGSVDVKALEAKVEASGDPALRQGLESIKDAFQRTEMRPVTSGCGGTVSSGCGGSPATRAVKVDPKSLDSGEVQNVMSALLAAKAEVRSLDSNGDSRIDRAEANRAKDLSGLAGELAEAAVGGATAGFAAELKQWNEALSGVARSVDQRRSLDERIVGKAREHAASETGAEAITWAYRDLATQPAGVDIWDMEKRLDDAETSFLRYIPFFGGAATGAGHLSDTEVKRMLGTDDLAGYAARKQAAVEARVGGDYAGHYLAGKDLDGVDQLNDPDFRKVSSGC